MKKLVVVMGKKVMIPIFPTFLGHLGTASAGPILREKLDKE